MVVASQEDRSETNTETNTMRAEVALAELLKTEGERKRRRTVQVGDEVWRPSTSVITGKNAI